MYDAETGLYYLRARYYDPSVGRFLNEDTYEGQIDNPLSLNLYTYVGNNPLIRIDPTGHDWLDKLSGFLNGVSDDLTFGLWTYAWDKVYTNRDDDYNKGYSSYLKYFTPQTEKEAQMQLVLSVIIGGTKFNYTNLNKSAAEGLKIASSAEMKSALSSYKNIYKTYGNVTVSADKTSMEHILGRHTFDYWQGKSKTDNTFFDPKQSVNDIRTLLDRALKSYQSVENIKNYTGGVTNWTVNLDGVDYQIGLVNHVVAQFHPLKKD